MWGWHSRCSWEAALPSRRAHPIGQLHSRVGTQPPKCRIKYTSYKFADSAKLSGVVGTPKGGEAIQRDLNKLEKYPHEFQ